VRPNGKWLLRTIHPIPVGDIPWQHQKFVLKQARQYFSGRRAAFRKKSPAKYDMAILVDPHEKEPPSNAAAIESFQWAAHKIGLGTEIVTRNDFSRLAEFDALFIRETTQVNHHTYRFARYAASEGLAVIDDPESILTCGNKVYLAELLARKKISIPRTLVVDRTNIDDVEPTLGFPCILKLPDAAFSLGVVKVDNQARLQEQAGEFLDRSALVVAQEYLPTSFDWRVGICDRKPLFACRYHMAIGHWQIIKRDKGGRRECGLVENVPLEDAPAPVIDTALQAANLIGDGFYGVDLKHIEDKVYVIEINDNPNVDAGNEDRVLKDKLYDRLMNVFLDRIERKKAEFDKR
jgi:glutathione synthase/RimK-type ligase-like ATP-grasp enzyme